MTYYLVSKSPNKTTNGTLAFFNDSAVKMCPYEDIDTSSEKVCFIDGGWLRESNDLRLGNCQLRRVRDCKCLGIILKSGLSFNVDAGETGRKFYTACNS